MKRNQVPTVTPGANSPLKDVVIDTPTFRLCTAGFVLVGGLVLDMTVALPRVLEVFLLPGAAIVCGSIAVCGLGGAQ